MGEFTLIQLQVVDFLNPDTPSALDYFFIFISFFGDWKVLAGLTALVLLKDRDLGKKMVLLFIIAGSLVFSLKTIANEERPPLVSEKIRPIGGVETGSSFPSGHATFAFAYASLIGAAYGMKRYFFAFAALIAFSRLYLGQHYPGDVLFGAFLGLASGYLTNYLYVKIEVHLWKP